MDERHIDRAGKHESGPARRGPFGGTDPHRGLDGPAASTAGYLPGESLRAEIAVYFADEPRKLYQLRQWLPVFERLDVRRPVVVVTRDAGSYAEVGRVSTLRRVLVPTLPDLAGVYESSDLKVALYVNNSMRNFQSLMARRMLHVHVNHGESDKGCMVGNQVKAYDRVFVAGPAAMQRHRAALIEFDETKLVPVGRPQLDLSPPSALPPTDRRTVLYAPTWEGETTSDDYTSVDRHGLAIVRAALALADVRVVYKPHPRVALSPDPEMADGHRRILRLLAEAARREPAAGHLALLDGDILAVLPGCDLMITDVSSVGPDFLYLHTDKPMFITDRREASQRRYADLALRRCTDVVDASTIGILASTLAARLARDEFRKARESVRRHYFGDLAPGESTERFLAAIDDVVAVRDRLTQRQDLAPDGALPEGSHEHEPVCALRTDRVPNVQIVILAAGLGTRLGLSIPKPLTPLADGRSILQRQFDHIQEVFGEQTRVTLVVGYGVELVMAAFPDAVFVYNERYRQTNTAKSLLKALRASADGGVLWLNGDIVFDSAVLEEIRPLIEADQSFVCVNTAAVGEEEVKYTVDGDGWVKRLSKQIPDGLGEAVGINYISLQDKAALITHLARCTEQDYFERGIELAIAEDGMRVAAADISAFFVVEVDFAGDLERVNTEVGRTVISAA